MHYYNLWKKNQNNHLLRQKLVRKFAWAIPDQKAINLCCKYSPLIEIGAGTGYWASLISKQNGKIICYWRQHFVLLRQVSGVHAGGGLRI